jgi:serine/threonine-protein kinase
MRPGECLQERFHIVREVARGSMGTIYAAEDQRLGREVAIKVPRDALISDAKFLERFRREALAAASLAHPNIASVFDYGDQDDHPFIVMELVQGQDLSETLKNGPLPVPRAIRVAEQVAAALAHAHEMGIVHRDIKPANIIVCDGQDDRIKVTDFGIARAAGDVTLTATGTLFGTPQYISPEQAVGMQATPLSDIYSLGIVLYEMLVGAPPFEGDSMVALAMRHVNEEVGPPSAVSPGLSPELDRVVLHATARAADERYQTAEEMRTALRQFDPVDDTSHHAEIPLEGHAPTKEMRPEKAAPTSKLSTMRGATRVSAMSRAQMLIAAAVAAIILVIAGALLFGGDNKAPRASSGTRQQKLDHSIDLLEELISR